MGFILDCLKHPFASAEGVEKTICLAPVRVSLKSISIACTTPPLFKSLLPTRPSLVPPIRPGLGFKP